MKVCIEKEEWYPVFMLEEPLDPSVFGIKDVPDEIFYKYKIALEQWKSIQSELRKIYYKHN